MGPNDFPKHSGMWWQTMGLTRTHFIGVFVVEFVLMSAAMGLFAGAVLYEFGDRLILLYSAMCLLLLQIGVLLASILSLLFYLCGWIQRIAENAYIDEH